MNDSFYFNAFSLRQLILIHQLEKAVVKLHKGHLAVVSRQREGSVGRTDVDLRQKLDNFIVAASIGSLNYQHEY